MVNFVGLVYFGWWELKDEGGVVVGDWEGEGGLRV